MRELRVLHFAFLAAVAAIVAAGEVVPVEIAAELPPIVFVILAAVAAADLGVVWILRQKKLGEARERLQRRPDDPQGLQDWRAGHILGFVFAVSAAFFGLVLRVLTGAVTYAVPLYAVAAAMLLAWAPRRPE